MIFFFLLRETGYDWPKAREVFYSLDDLKITWLGEVLRRETGRFNKVYPPGSTVKSFDLRGEGFGRRDGHY